jgi:hypothetical protein
MMFTGYREFDAYARNLRRTVWARQLEQAAKSVSVAGRPGGCDRNTRQRAPDRALTERPLVLACAPCAQIRFASSASTRG